MLLLGVLAALLAAGLWMYALIDILLTPGADCRRRTKRTWLAIAGLLSVPGALAWLALGRPYATSGRYLPGRTPHPPWLGRPRTGLAGPDADPPLLRHPAWRARHEMPEAGYAGEFPDGPQVTSWPVGPDDDPEFLDYLDGVIRDIREAGNGA